MELSERRKALIQGLCAFMKDRHTDFPVGEADPVLCFYEQDDETGGPRFTREEAELALATHLMNFLSANEDDPEN